MPKMRSGSSKSADVIMEERALVGGARVPEGGAREPEAMSAGEGAQKWS